MSQSISAEFPYESKFVEVHGQKMHYIEEGKGDPILFLHGNPTSCYLWRNIIPHVSSLGRCIAPDLIGMGKSDKPNLKYRFSDHYKYISGFIKAMGLKNITLVIHDWGSGLGFHYAHQNPDNIKAMAFMEAIVAPAKWSDFPKDFKIGFKLMRTPFVGWLMISIMNVFVKEILPKATVRKLSDEEMRRYNEPYTTIGSRKPIRQWPCEIPIDGHPADVQDVVESYNQWLQVTDIPKLLFYARPGGLITAKVVEYLKDHFPNLKAIEIGEGLHYVQEDQPHAIGKGLAYWYSKLR